MFCCLPEVACWMVTGERQAARIRRLYLKTILRQDVAFFDKETNTGEVVGRMSGDTVLIQDAMGEKVLKCCYSYIKSNDPVFCVSLHKIQGFKNCVCAGWEIFATDYYIHRRLCGSIYQRVASNPCHVILSSSSCGIWCSYVHHHTQDGVPGTKCLCKSSKCS